MENPARLQAKKRSVWPTYFLLGIISPARASSSSDNLAPIASDWLFLCRLSADAEEKEMARLAALLDDGAGAGRAVETPGIWRKMHVIKAEIPKN